MKTVHIGETEGTNELYFVRDINHINFQTGHDLNWKDAYNATDSLKDNVGNVYSNSLSLRVYDVSKGNTWQYIEYLLNGKVKNLKSKVGLTDELKSIEAEVTVTISGDYKVLYTS